MRRAFFYRQIRSVTPGTFEGLKPDVGASTTSKAWAQMPSISYDTSYSLNALKGVIGGDYIGDYDRGS